MVEQQVWLLD